MKRKCLFFAAIAMFALTLSSCDKETEGVTDITYYAKCTFDYGDYISIGGDFSPSFNAVCNGVDVTDEVQVTIEDISGNIVDEVNTNEPGIYNISYYHLNQDNKGFETTRTVYIYNPDLQISLVGEFVVDMEKSVYYTTDGKIMTFNQASEKYGYSGDPVSIVFSEILPGFYKCNDLLAKWYDQIRGYNDANEGKYDFKANSIVFLNSNGSISLLSSSVPAWGDALDYIDNATYNAETGELSYFVSYAEEVVRMNIVANLIKP